MRILSGLSEPAAVHGAAIAIGNFDGVHRGHQEMIRVLRDCAERSGVPAVVFTFDPHPVRVLCSETPHFSLSTLDYKLELLQHYGVDTVVVMPTPRDLLELSPQQFLADVVVRQMQASGLVEGTNFRFGRGRSGDVRTLQSLCTEHGLQLEIVQPVSMAGAVVSSSRIRELVVDGSLERACEMLGHTYQLSGTVVAGARRGRELGFPTANLEDVHTLIPGDGVYAGRAVVDDCWFTAAISVGTNPTFGDGPRSIEVHLLDFNRDLYGQTLRVEFLQRIRETQPFSSIEQLKTQLHDDVGRIRKIVASQH